MRISDWSSDVCSSDLLNAARSCEPELSAWPGSVSQGLYRPGPGLVPPVSRQPCPLCLARTSTSRSPTPISPDRQGVALGESVSVRVDIGGLRTITKKKPDDVISTESTYNNTT